MVNIAVNPVGAGYELCVYPRRRGDTIAFCANQGKPPTNGRPREVIWAGYGLQPGMTIKITPKAGVNTQLLPNLEYELTDSNSMVGSGPVWLPQNAGEDTWSYSVELFDGGGGLLHRLDPDLIIKPDP